MKLYEKPSLSISCFSLFISISSPFLIYFWLNSFELKKIYRPILTVTTTESIGLSPDDVQSKSDGTIIIRSQSNFKKETTNYRYTMSVINEGKVPAQDVYFYIYPLNNEFKFPETLELHMDPPDNFIKTIGNGSIKITLDRAIGIGERVTFVIRGITLSKTANINLLGGRVYHKFGEAERYYNEHKTRIEFAKDN